MLACTSTYYLHVMVAVMIVVAVLLLSMLLRTDTLLLWCASSYECGVVSVHASNLGWSVDTLYVLPLCILMETAAVLMLSSYQGCTCSVVLILSSCYAMDTVRTTYYSCNVLLCNALVVKSISTYMLCNAQYTITARVYVCKDTSTTTCRAYVLLQPLSIMCKYLHVM